MGEPRPCGAIVGKFCSGETEEDDCMECIGFVNTCDHCHSPGHIDSIGWREGPNGETLCTACANGGKHE